MARRRRLRAERYAAALRPHGQASAAGQELRLLADPPVLRLPRLGRGSAAPRTSRRSRLATRAHFVRRHRRCWSTTRRPSDPKCPRRSSRFASKPDLAGRHRGIWTCLPCSRGPRSPRSPADRWPKACAPNDSNWRAGANSNVCRWSSGLRSIDASLATRDRRGPRGEPGVAVPRELDAGARRPPAERCGRLPQGRRNLPRRRLRDRLSRDLRQQLPERRRNSAKSRWRWATPTPAWADRPPRSTAISPPGTPRAARRSG